MVVTDQHAAGLTEPGVGAFDHPASFRPGNPIPGELPAKRTELENGVLYGVATTHSEPVDPKTFVECTGFFVDSCC
jgi:hypothetical protein